MMYLVWADNRIGARTIVAQSAKDAVRRWADAQRVAVGEDEAVNVVVVDGAGTESQWTITLSFDYTIKERA